MKSKISLLLLLVFAASACGQKVVVLHKGKAYLVDLSKAEQVPIAKTEGSSTDPTDPVDPTDPTTDLGKRAKELAAGVDPADAAAVGSAYATIGDRVSKGRIAPGDANKRLSTTLDLLFRMQPPKDKAKVDSLRTKLAAEINKLINAGKFTTKDQVAGAFKEVSNGLLSQAKQSAADSGQALDLDFWLMIIELVLELIERLRNR